MPNLKKLRLENCILNIENNKSILSGKWPLL